jgi:hypothetical protein
VLIAILETRAASALFFESLLSLFVSTPSHPRRSSIHAVKYTWRYFPEQLFAEPGRISCIFFAGPQGLGISFVAGGRIVDFSTSSVAALAFLCNSSLAMFICSSIACTLFYPSVRYLVSRVVFLLACRLCFSGLSFESRGSLLDAVQI